MIGIGVIGYGYWGPNLARCAAEADDCRLAAVADRSPDALARAQKRHPAAFATTDWRELIAAPSVDAVIVATPVETHFEIALAAIRAGKHVLVEKPITTTSHQTLILIEEAKRAGVVLMVDHTFVYTGAVRKIHELVQGGQIGDVYYYDATRINLGLFQRDVNVIWDLAVHDLAILDFVLAAKPVAVSASGAGHFHGNPENMARVTLFFDSGTIANVSVNWLAPVKVRQALIGGSKRMIVYDDLEPSEKVKVYDRGVDVTDGSDDARYRVLVGYRSGDMWAPQIPVVEALLTEMEHFAACIRDGTEPLTDGACGLRVVEMLESASLSLKQRGHPVELQNWRYAS